MYLLLTLPLYELTLPLIVILIIGHGCDYMWWFKSCDSICKTSSCELQRLIRLIGWPLSDLSIPQRAHSLYSCWPIQGHLHHDSANSCRNVPFFQFVNESSRSCCTSLRSVMLSSWSVQCILLCAAGRGCKLAPAVLSTLCCVCCRWPQCHDPV